MKFGARIRADLIDDYSAEELQQHILHFSGDSSGVSSLLQYLKTEQLLAAGYTSQQVTAMGYRPSQYSVSVGKPFISLSQIDAGPFFQDDWKLRPNFTFSAGIRWEGLQTNISDKNDWAPRARLSMGAAIGRSKTMKNSRWLGYVLRSL